MQNLHADGLYHEPASKCNFDLNRQNTLLLNLFGTIGRKNTTLDGMYHMLLLTVYILAVIDQHLTFYFYILYLKELNCENLANVMGLVILTTLFQIFRCYNCNYECSFLIIF